jgi:hypothetical protein
MLITLIVLMIMLFVLVTKVAGTPAALGVFSVSLLVFSVQEKKKNILESKSQNV